MIYQVVESNDVIDEWRAEAVDSNDEGKCYVVIFSGPDSEKRANEYVQFKNSQA